MSTGQGITVVPPVSAAMPHPTTIPIPMPAPVSGPPSAGSARNAASPPDGAERGPAVVIPRAETPAGAVPAAGSNAPAPAREDTGTVSAIPEPSPGLGLPAGGGSNLFRAEMQTWPLEEVRAEHALILAELRARIREVQASADHLALIEGELVRRHAAERADPAGRQP